MRARRVIVGVIGLSLLGAGASATRGASPKSAAISPALAKAIDEAASSDAAAQKRGVAALEAAMAQQAAALASVEEPELADRVAAVLERHIALTAYTRDVLTLPPAEARAAIRWALAEERIAAVAGAYSRDAIQRALAAEQIAGMIGPEPERILGKLLRDRNWAVGAEAVDLVRTRPASPPVIDALWERAVERGLNTRQRYVPQKVVEFKGRRLRGGGGYDPNSGYDTTTDPEAADVLSASKSPLVEKKLLAYFARLAGNLGNAEFQQEYTAYFQPTQNAMLILEAQKLKSAIPLLMDIVTGTETATQSMKNANLEYYCSSRTVAMVMLLRVTGQDFDAYGLKRQNTFGQGNYVAANEKAHREAEEKLRAWYKANKAPYEAALEKARKDGLYKTPAKPADTDEGKGGKRNETNSPARSSALPVLVR